MGQSHSRSPAPKVTVEPRPHRRRIIAKLKEILFGHVSVEVPQPLFDSPPPDRAADRYQDEVNNAATRYYDARAETCELPPLSENCPAYKHKALKDASSQIRLLRIVKSRPLDLIRCTLSTHNLEEQTGIYIAMSYRWGQPHPPKTIYINDRPMQVTYNAWFALRQMKFHAAGELYWMDSICVNQSNIKQKSSQVRLMQKIFRNAWRVAVCIGSSPLHSNYLHPNYEQGFIDTIREASSAVVAPDAQLRNYRALGELSQDPYFQRLWIVQEVILAAQVDIYFGMQTFPEQIIQSIDTGHDCHALFSRRLHGPPEEGEDLPALMIRHAANKCDMPHDRIYSLLSISNVYSTFDIDYGRSLLQVLRDFIVNCGKQLNSRSSGKHQYTEFLRSISLLRDHYHEEDHFIQQAREFLCDRRTSTWEAFKRGSPAITEDRLIFTYGHSICVTADDLKTSDVLRYGQVDRMERDRSYRRFTQRNAGVATGAIQYVNQSRQKEVQFYRELLLQSLDDLEARIMKVGGVEVMAPSDTVEGDLIVEIGQRQHMNDLTQSNDPIFALACRPSKAKDCNHFHPIGWVIPTSSRALWLHRGQDHPLACHTGACPSRAMKQLELHSDDLLNLVLLRMYSHSNRSITSALIAACFPLTTGQTRSIVVDVRE